MGHSVTVRCLAGVLTSESHYLDFARSSLDWLAERQDKSGGWKRYSAFTLDGAQCVFEGFNTFEMVTGDRRFHDVLVKLLNSLRRFFNLEEVRMTSVREQAAKQCAAILGEKFFKAFSKPARAAVFQQVVLLGATDIGSIAENLPQDRSVVSRHLQVLADAGVLTARKQGRRVFYSVNVLEIEQRLQQMLEFTHQLAVAGENSGESVANN